MTHHKLKLFNTLTHDKNDFIPSDPTHVTLYACGPTVYNYAHIGNARMAVVFDILSRVLRYHYPKTTYVSNITDIDDKIIAAARENNEPIKTITERYTKIYNNDMSKLNVLPPDVQPKATDHIPDMISLIEKLILNKAAYHKDGHVLFHVPTLTSYGSLSGRDRDQQLAGSRVDIAPYKKDPGDFVLWKPSTTEQPGWESPWGFGRPGWHIECSAMLERYLGLPADIHGGGMDLVFPHHENEWAQSCCAHNTLDGPENFAKYWVHNGFVTMGNEKMSKSLGNIQRVHELLDQYPGETLRLALLSSHYRQPLKWTDNLIQQQQTTLDKLYRALHNAHDIPTTPTQEHIPPSIIEALADDLNTPKAIAALHALASALHQSKSTIEKKRLKTHLQAAGNYLGLLQQTPAEWLGFSANSSEDQSNIEALIQARNTARSEKDYAKADEIRNTLKSMNIEIEDSPTGTQWRRI